MSATKFIIHVQLPTGEAEIPLFAEDLTQATEWSEEQYEDQGFVVNRVRPARKGE